MKIKNLCPSVRLSLLGCALNLITLLIYCVYGLVYDYFDGVVFLALALGAACAAGYVLWDHWLAELLELLAVACVSFGVGLFFLNSYPVWADRLNNITMYGSRGTLFPVVTIILLCFAVIIIHVISCFTRKERSAQ